MFTFVTGGLRSGKSEYALRRASELGPPPWLYVAAHIEGDDELKARLANHRRDHDTTWKLIEAPEQADHRARPGDAGRAAARWSSTASPCGSPSGWRRRRRAADGDLLAEVEALADRLYRSPTPAVVVTTEIGLGFLPANVPDRRLINVAGKANQILSERAESVVLMVSGVPLRLR